MLFRKWVCLVGSENSIFRKLKSVDQKKKPLTTEMLLHFYFTFKGFLENERERERERERARARREDPVRDRELQLQSEIAIDGEIAPSIAISWRRRDRDPARSRSRIATCRDRDLGLRSRCDRDLGSRSRRDRNRAVDRDRAVSAVITIALSIAISDRDRAVSAVIAISDRDHGAVVGLETFLELMIFFFWVVACGLCFLICVFLLLFQTPENIFRKFFWNATKHMETFSFSGN